MITQSSPAETGAKEEHFLRDVWYMGALAGSVKAGSLTRQMLLGEPVVIGRTQAGQAFALRDICPPRGVPLSAGRVTEANSVECPYHGWTFRTDGFCSAIPSLVDGKDVDPTRIRVRAYPVHEQDGLIWIYMAAPGHETAPPLGGPPKIGLAGATPRWVESQTFACGIDHAVIGLMDPAHAPYVHGRWWWRVRPRLKSKDYTPLPRGFVMVRHAPATTARKLFGGGGSPEI